MSVDAHLHGEHSCQISSPIRFYTTGP